MNFSLKRIFGSITFKPIIDYFRVAKEYNKKMEILLYEFIKSDNERFFNWLYNNDFEYRDNQFIKTDVVDYHKHLRGHDEDWVREKILVDFYESLVKLFENHPFDLLTICNIYVKVYLKEWELNDVNSDEKLTLKNFFDVILAPDNYPDYILKKERFRQALFDISIILIPIISLIAYIFLVK